MNFSLSNTSTVPEPKRLTSDRNVKTDRYHAKQDILSRFLLKTIGKEKGGRVCTRAARLSDQFTRHLFWDPWIMLGP